MGGCGVDQELSDIERAEIEKVWQEFWADLVAPDGTVDVDQVKKELHDYAFMLREVPKVYCELTGNRLSKPHYDADVVIREHDEVYVRRDEAADGPMFLVTWEPYHDNSEILRLCGTADQAMAVVDDLRATAAPFDIGGKWAVTPLVDGRIAVGDDGYDVEFSFYWRQERQSAWVPPQWEDQRAALLAWRLT
jgi:hypothetical protein